MSSLMQNLNGNLLCAIDTETTGKNPEKHEIIEIAIIPLDDNIKISAHHMPFILDMIPLRPENIDPEALEVNKRTLTNIMNTGMDPFKAADRLVEWFEGLNLGYNKRIAPLGCNWPFDREFMIQWLGPATFNLIFDSRYRDIQPAAIFVNDVDGWFGRDFSYPKIGLSFMSTWLKVGREKAHNAADDARVTAEVYRKMVLAGR